ncbi:winged helix-turn-helix domain-containing protein [Enterococcus sp. 669A]|uniref:Winged helix-turn-helix domain-containing protein n=1 Tax=Candidatus Enterococcus moelleringii TaxID=2815325 RepID=A0ABS3LCG2_9ENTE|nr:helix-turn-helix domain-containing protein [Enterococcus sp. 669A]MBO1306723.1 winged helix-turn-helix domain-containing protein [Enterococcus sp. 669A]
MKFEYVLLLTKNALNETDIQLKLQRMDIDVFCTTHFSDGIEFSKRFSQLLGKHWLVILSETLSDNEVEEIAEKLNGRITMIRKMDSPPKVERLEKMKNQGIKDWIPCAATIEDFHELFAVTQSTVTIEEEQDLVGKQNIAVLYRLTKIERDFINKLFEAKGEVLSREELAQDLWKSNESKSLDSSKAQLSMITKNINKKVGELFKYGIMIQTVWGRGYRLTDEVLRNYYI